MKKTSFKEIRLIDYAPPAFLIDETKLDFDIHKSHTTVKSRLIVKRNPACKNDTSPLVLMGEAQRLIKIAINGKLLPRESYKLDEHSITIPKFPARAIVEIESTNEPQKNTALSGLYAAGKMLCTQCEPEGFRRITYYPDRPDVMSKFTVTIHADRKQYPILLSNGNLIAKGKEAGGRHWVKWQDPFKKPAYLFALVAGKLEKVSDKFKTKSGRKVLIELYTEPGRKSETGFAISAIKKSMKWDEDTYGLEYDLNRFMLVAVSFFNMGAMENKGLNIFNDSCVLGKAETAPDDYIEFIERVVGHEYFHNWTGDRVTCRDWFQLSLKEGLTVFREQEFCGDMNARALERLHSITSLRRSQFAEDAGAMAHPIRPASYKAIDNFYTSTVYGKGAEVVRMIQTLAGRKGFKKGLNLYIKRHDGQAATCENFVSAMADANNLDLKQFMLWYSQAGTPALNVKSKYNEKKKTFTLNVKQSCPPTPGQPKKLPFHIPFAIGLLNPKAKNADMMGTKVLSLRKAQEKFVFKNVRAEPIPSLLREFSAPVRLNYSYTESDLLFLMSKDSDAFNRWEAGQKLFMKYILSGKKRLPAKFINALRAVLRDKNLDAATKAMTLALPTEGEIGLAWRAKNKLIDPIAIFETRRAISKNIAEELQDDFWVVFEDLSKTTSERSSDGVSRGKRSLKNLCLSYLSKARPEDALPLAAEMVAASKNMTDQTTALDILVDMGGKTSQAMLALFEKRYTGKPNIMDEWLSSQASARKNNVLKAVKKLMKHKDFAINNPNRVSALIGTFAANPLGFHAADGSGYRFIADTLMKIDALNPQSAARLAKAFLRWRDYEPKRQRMMRAQLKRMAKNKKLSVNCHEIITKSLR
ncbi:MAG: aminopeptidase N [Alphaproteobacteria bacterium]|nr:aminopeptidase N [Alphaproteobacteria bacterium]